MSSWTKYPSINDADLETVAKIQGAVSGRGVEFVALEKVHGSNFAFETDGHSILHFSRNKRLDKDEQFVGRTTVATTMTQYHTAVHKAFMLAVCQKECAPRSVLIYGEYFGGWFPHSEAPACGPGAGNPVQKGVVAYAPDHHFLAFDVCIDGEYLDFDESTALLLAAGFPLVTAPIVRGSFDECMAFDVEGFETTIPTILGLPSCQQYSIAEGLVVRPLRRHAAWTVKRKSVRYLEACPQELRKWVTKCATSKSDGLTGLYLSLCREPRLRSVLSKQPQLRENHSQMALLTVQQLYREDVEAAWQQRVAAAGVQVPASYSFREARAEADRRVVAWLNAEDACHKSHSGSQTTASSGDEAVQQESVPEQTVADVLGHAKQSMRLASSVVEKRIDPEDGLQVAGGKRRGFRRRNGFRKVKASSP